MHSRMSNGCRAAFPAPPRLILTDLLYCLCQLQIIYKRRLVMAFTEITPEEININPFTSWSRYVLVTAGNIEKCNTLLVTWGGFGVMWRKKTATIYIRQSRFTKTILDSQDYFTLSFLPEKHKPQMSYMGSHSGRDENKYEGSGLHPLAIGDAAGIEEADLIFVCKKFIPPR